MYLDLRLVVRGGREDLALGDRYRSVLVDYLREDAAERFKAERKRRYVDEDDALLFAGEYRALDGRAHRDAFVGVDALRRLFAHQFLDERLHHRHTGRAADEEDFVYLRGLEAGVLERRAHRRLGPLEEVAGQVFELGARQLLLEVLRAVGVRGDERERYRGLLHRGELYLRLFSGFAQTLRGHFVLQKVDAVALLELRGEPLDYPVVPVVAAEPVVARGREDFEDSVADVEDRNVERSAAEVVDHYLVVALLKVDAVGEAGRRRLVDDAEHVEARDCSRVLRRLALCVGEVGRAGDYGFGYRGAEVFLSVLLELLQYHRGNLLRRVVLAVDGDGFVAAHRALDRYYGTVGVDYRLAFRELPYEYLSVLREGYDGRRRALSFGVRDYRYVVSFFYRYAAVSCSEVYSYYFSHG